MTRLVVKCFGYFVKGNLPFFVKKSTFYSFFSLLKSGLIKQTKVKKVKFLIQITAEVKGTKKKIELVGSSQAENVQKLPNSYHSPTKLKNLRVFVEFQCIWALTFYPTKMKTDKKKFLLLGRCSYKSKDITQLKIYMEEQDECSKKQSFHQIF